jgi:hypothetical protein
MLFKMLSLTRVTQYAVNKPRQLFVTQSNVLANKVQDYFKQLSDSLNETNMSVKGLSRGRMSQETKFTLVADHDDGNCRRDLPERFSALQDHHYPLFLTYNQVIVVLLILTKLIFRS